MNWEDYRKYYDKMTKVEKTLINSRLGDWTDAHSLGDEKIDANWSRTDVDFAKAMFKAGWIAHAIEIGGEPILLPDTEQDTRNKNMDKRVLVLENMVEYMTQIIADHVFWERNEDIRCRNFKDRMKEIKDDKH